MRKSISVAFFLAFVALIVFGLVKNNRDDNTTDKTQQKTDAGSIELLFTYGSEKEDWINDVTKGFNDHGHKISDGRRVKVEAIPMGSGESIDELLSGRRKAHLTSPASSVFVKLGNAKSRVKSGDDLIGSTQNLVLSPVVIAMWKPMAEALGWGKKPLGWSDILTMVETEGGWKTKGFPQWGAFKFGHTHPEYSNSGIISILAEVYAATGKVSGLSLADIGKSDVGSFVSRVEQAVVHYGSSTGFFGKAMFANGPSYLSAAVLYENMVVEAASKDNLAFPVVAIYPREGTFWSDHPVGIVNREWVTESHKEAAKLYIDYLLDQKQQETAMSYGFRPGDIDIPLTSPLDTEHGINPAEPKTTLEVPSPEVIDAALKLWKANKKHSSVVLVFDTSGSMREDDKMSNARDGANELISLMDVNDFLSLLPFSSNPVWAIKSASLKEKRGELTTQVDSLMADGETALYDAVIEGFDYIQKTGEKGKISAMVVLSDGADNKSDISLTRLLGHIRSDGEKRAVRIFTIGYGSGARADVLEQIANETKAKYFAGTTENIREVFKEISTFF